MKIFLYLSATWRDLRYGLRLLRKTPGLTLAATLTLGIGLGANTAIFSVVDTLLLRALPYPDSDELALVQLATRSNSGEQFSISHDGRTWELVRDNVTSFDRAVFSDWVTGVNAVAQGNAAYVRQQRVGAGFFGVLGVAPLIGREFTPVEDVPGGPRVAILSHALWARAFDADPTIVGEVIALRGESFTVVGVMPPDFRSTTPADVWTPLRPSRSGEGDGMNYGIVTRLRPEATWPQARAEALAIGQTRWREFRNTEGATGTLSLVPLQDALSTEVRAPLLVLWGAVGLVLLIVCANVASLLLARSNRRAREMATRMALGSGRRAVIRQLVLESVVLALLGGLLGLGLGHLGLRGLQWIAADYGLWQPITVDTRIVVVSLALALATSLAFGLVPAMHVTRLDASLVLAGPAARGTTVRAVSWSRRLLVTGEVALSVLLMVGAILLVRSFAHLTGLPSNLDPHGVVTATFSMQDARYATSEAMNRFFDESLQRLRRLPGVSAAGVALGLPYERLLNLGFQNVDDPDQRTQLTSLSYITPGFFEALGMDLLSGRRIATSDQAGSVPVAVVNAAWVETYANDRDALGSRIAVGGTEREIVGVVASAQQRPGWGQPVPLTTSPTIYIPAAQTTADFLALVHTWFEPSWIVRSNVPPEALVAGIQAAVREADPRMPIASFQDLAAVQRRALSQQRLLMILITTLGGIAVFLALIGIYGLVSNAVVERTRELGIRLALGAPTTRAVHVVAMPGIALAALGTFAGTGLAVASGRILRSFLWGVTPTDPGTLVGVALALLAVASVASVLPALRVLRLDPGQTLRQE